jgi:hypothetical protein
LPIFLLYNSFIFLFIIYHYSYILSTKSNLQTAYKIPAVTVTDVLLRQNLNRAAMRRRKQSLRGSPLVKEKCEAFLRAQKNVAEQDAAKGVLHLWRARLVFYVAVQPLRGKDRHQRSWSPTLLAMAASCPLVCFWQTGGLLPSVRSHTFGMRRSYSPVRRHTCILFNRLVKQVN